MIWMSKLV